MTPMCCLRDDVPTVAMTNEDLRSRHVIENSFDKCDVVREASEGQINRDGRNASSRKLWKNFLPGP